MNRKTFLAFAIGSALVLAAVVPAAAQDPGSVDATIPFAFNVGSKALPAGNYEVRPWGANVLIIRNTATHDGVLTLVMKGAPKTNSEEAKLVFHQYGENLFLSQIRTPDTRADLPMSKRERETASRAAETAKNSSPRVIYLAVRAH